MNRFECKLRLLLGLAILIPATWAPSAVAGEFAIVPLRVNLDRANRAAEVSIRNVDTAPLRMQVDAMTWTQNADGKDVYSAADGLIYFPRALEIAPGESRVVRVGIRAAPVSREETYRLFVQELPPVETSTGSAAMGASIRVLLRIGVPVFVAPDRIERRAEIAQLSMSAGTAQLKLTNPGSVHFTADRVELAALARDGSRLHSQQFQERYFLAGAVKPLQLDVPPGICAQVAALEALVVGENVDLRRKVDVEPGACN